MSTAIKSTDLPAPDVLVEYPDGTLCAVMFHYMPSEASFREVAEDMGFDVHFVGMEASLDDEDPLAADYAEGGSRWTKEWKPATPDGWTFAGTSNSEDGPFAVFLRKRELAGGAS